MNLLAVETSTELCSVALLREADLFVEEVHAPNQHAERLMPLIAKVLERARLSPKSMDAFAFGQGPGSFTGIRIACGVIQGLAFGAARPVIAVPSLLALAEQANENRVIAAIDARLGEAWLAAYSRMGGDWQAVIEPVLAKEGALPPLPGHSWIATGSGFDAFSWLRSTYARSVSHRIEGDLPRAGSIVRIAARRLARGEVLAPDESAPLYLREKVALTTNERQALS